MAKAQETIHSKIIQSALELASQNAWQDVSLNDIALNANLDMSQIIEFYDDQNDVIAMYGKDINKKLAEQFKGQSLEGDSIKDRLFDILMERFDLLNNDRSAILSILNTITMDPHQIIVTMPWLCKSMGIVLEIANVPSHGWQGGLRIAGLSAVYIKTLRAWVNDDSQDMAVTMAALDKNLGYAERAGQFLKI
jgi:ubiquinone biosynthesis protein COQ9